MIYNEIYNENYLYILLVIAITTIFSLSFATLYYHFKKYDNGTKDVPTLIILPVVLTITTIAILLISKNVLISENQTRIERCAIALLGVIVFIRFRSIPKNTEDLTYILFLSIVGLLNGMGFLLMSCILYIIILTLIVLIHVFEYKKTEKNMISFKITIPEDLNFEDTFEELFNKFSSFHRLSKIKTSDMGTVFVLTYDVIIKKDANIKEFVDLIRERNGNLNVAVILNKDSVLE